MIQLCSISTRIPGLHQPVCQVWLQLVQQLQVRSPVRQQRRGGTLDCSRTRDRHRLLHATLCSAASAGVSADADAPSTSGTALAPSPPRRDMLIVFSPVKYFPVMVAGTMEMELQGRSYRIIQLVSQPHLHTAHVRHAWPGQLPDPLRGVQEGCEYLIATDEAGRLDLRDAYVHDLETDIFARPESSGRMPDGPSMCAPSYMDTHVHCP